jgi:acyl-CoA synthetase (AMP-forming)/AMP-acid ligase II
MHPAEWLVRAARRWPTAPALQTGPRVEADYAGFARRAASIGAALRARHGIGRQDRVGLFMSNRRAYLEALYGIWFAGAAVVPINAKLHVREAAQILAESGARLALVSDDVGHGLGGILPDTVSDLVSADDKEFEALATHAPLDAPVPIAASEMAWLFYTSGTTSRPKGAMLTSGNLQAMTFSYFVDVDPVEQQDAALYAAPMSHGAGLYNFMHVLRGARHVVPESGGFDADEILRLAPRIGQVSMFAAPTMVRRLVDAAKASGSDGDGIKTIVDGGGPMYLADAVEAVDVLGPRFVQIYGQGESPMTITALPRASIRRRSTATASSMSRASSGRRSMSWSRNCRRTTTARS